MLNSLPRRIRVMAKRGANSAHLVGRDRNSYTTPANQDAPLGQSFLKCVSECLGGIRIVDGLSVEGPQVLDVVGPRSQLRKQL